MHHWIDTILKQLRQDVAKHLQPGSIFSACRAVGHTWRQCALDPVAIGHWFLTQVLHGNTSLEHIANLAGRRFTGAAYCTARSVLPLAVFQTILHETIKALIPDTEADDLWRGHRTFLVDGSSFSMPDTPELQEKFGQPGGQKPGCGFPAAKILAMFHAGAGVLLKVVVTPLRSHEMSSVGGVHPARECGDVLVGDRGFCSFAHLAMLTKRGVYAVFRARQRRNIDFTPGRRHVPPGAPAPGPCIRINVFSHPLWFGVPRGDDGLRIGSGPASPRRGSGPVVDHAVLGAGAPSCLTPPL